MLAKLELLNVNVQSPTVNLHKEASVFHRFVISLQSELIDKKFKKHH